VLYEVLTRSGQSMASRLSGGQSRPMLQLSFKSFRVTWLWGSSATVSNALYLRQGERSHLPAPERRPQAAQGFAAGDSSASLGGGLLNLVPRLVREGAPHS